MVPFLRSSPPVQCSASSSWIPIHRAKRYNPIQQLGLYSLINLPLLSMKILQQSVKKLLWFAEADKLWTWSQSYVCFVFFFCSFIHLFYSTIAKSHGKKKKKEENNKSPKISNPCTLRHYMKLLLSTVFKRKITIRNWKLDSATKRDNMLFCGSPSEGRLCSWHAKSIAQAPNIS